MHDFNMENSVWISGHFWSEAMIPPTLSALSDLQLNQASPPAPSTPLKHWALFQLNRQSANKGKFIKGERSDIFSSVPLKIPVSSPSWAHCAHKPACNATFWSLMPRKRGVAGRTEVHLPFHFNFLTPSYQSSWTVVTAAAAQDKQLPLGVLISEFSKPVLPKNTGSNL